MRSAVMVLLLALTVGFAARAIVVGGWAPIFVALVCFAGALRLWATDGR